MAFRNQLGLSLGLILILFISCVPAPKLDTSVDIKANNTDGELSITLGESVTLTWSIVNPPTNRSCKLIQNEEGPEKGDEELPIENKCGGTKTVTPSKSTQYTISGTSNQGVPVTDKVIVKVEASVPSIASFSSNKLIITQGEEVTLSWKAENAELCTLKADVGSTSEETVNCESTKVFKPDSNTSYTFKAARAGGEDATEQTVSIEVKKPQTIKVIAYAWADQASAASYTPNSIYSYNSAGGAITATRISAGAYTMSFADLTITGGNVQVSSYGDDEYCNVISWGFSSVSVRCHNSSGVATDSKYTVTVISN